MIVADASVVVVALADDTEEGDRTRRRLRDDGDLHAPHLLDVEATSALRRLALVQQQLNAKRARAALDDLAGLPVTRYPHTRLLVRAWELRHNVRPSDGVYIALAEGLATPFVTGDARLGSASGPRCEVEVLA